MAWRMEFECKLAHCDQIKRISNFKSIKELYEQVARSFEIPIDEILYCTVNTHNFRDMDAILGNYLSFGDIIVAHICGQNKDLQLIKTQEYLGLTITDNGRGRAFVKKVKSDQQSVEDNIKPGDHIAAINAESTVGLRHFEVAKAIREVPKGTNFTIRLIEPKYSEKFLIKLNQVQKSSDSHQFSTNGSTLPINTENSTCTATSPNGGDLIFDELIHSSLPIERLLSKRGTLDAENDACGNSARLGFQDKQHDLIPNNDAYRSTINNINVILESFLNISDNLLAIQIYRLARENEASYAQFLHAIQTSELSAFDFSNDMKKCLWDCTTNQAKIQR